LFIEKGIDSGKLSGYDILIAPELKLLDDKDAEIIKQYVEQGGRLIVLGAFGTMISEGQDYLHRETSLVKQWTGREMANDVIQVQVGKGKISGCTTYLTGNSESAMNIEAGFFKAAEYVGLDAQLKINYNGEGRIASVIRKSASSRFIHLIRYNNKGKTDPANVSIVYHVPEKLSVKKVSAVSPYSNHEEMGVNWKVKGTSLFVEITGFESYAMFTVEFA
jgi:hypothetical protein